MLYFGFMKRGFLFYILLFPFAMLHAQLPDCDIWVLSIEKIVNGKMVFEKAENITSRKGYDNQPAFSPDGKYILYSSQRDSGGQTDIYKYDIEKKITLQVTKTETSEYSPAFIPGKSNFFSVVMVEKDSIQRLWKFSLNGGKPDCIMDNVDSVGYYCWLNSNSIALYLLSAPHHSLHLANILTQQTTFIADNIGRSLHKIPNYNMLSFTTKNGMAWELNHSAL